MYTVHIKEKTLFAKYTLFCLNIGWNIQSICHMQKYPYSTVRKASVTTMHSCTIQTWFNKLFICAIILRRNDYMKLQGYRCTFQLSHVYI